MCQHFLWDTDWGHNVEHKAAIVLEQARGAQAKINCSKRIFLTHFETYKEVFVFAASFLRCYYQCQLVGCHCAQHNYDNIFRL